MFCQIDAVGDPCPQTPITCRIRQNDLVLEWSCFKESIPLDKKILLKPKMTKTEIIWPGKAKIWWLVILYNRFIDEMFHIGALSAYMVWWPCYGPYIYRYFTRLYKILEASPPNYSSGVHFWPIFCCSFIPSSSIMSPFNFLQSCHSLEWFLKSSIHRFQIFSFRLFTVICRLKMV